MNKLTLIARIALGLVFFGAGVGGFASHFAFPPDLPEKLLAFTQGLAASGFFLPFLKGTEIVCGLLLLSGRFVPLALVVLAPIVLNIFLTHLFLAPQGVPLALVIGALEIYLAFFSQYKESIRPLFTARFAKTL